MNKIDMKPRHYIIPNETEFVDGKLIFHYNLPNGMLMKTEDLLWDRYLTNKEIEVLVKEQKDEIKEYKEKHENRF